MIFLSSLTMQKRNYFSFSTQSSSPSRRGDLIHARDAHARLQRHDAVPGPQAVLPLGRDPDLLVVEIEHRVRRGHDVVAQDGEAEGLRRGPLHEEGALAATAATAATAAAFIIAADEVRERDGDVHGVAVRVARGVVPAQREGRVDAGVGPGAGDRGGFVAVRGLFEAQVGVERLDNAGGQGGARASRVEGREGDGGAGRGQVEGREGGVGRRGEGDAGEGYRVEGEDLIVG